MSKKLVLFARSLRISIKNKGFPWIVFHVNLQKENDYFMFIMGFL